MEQKLRGIIKNPMLALTFSALSRAAKQKLDSAMYHAISRDRIGDYSVRQPASLNGTTGLNCSHFQIRPKIFVIEDEYFTRRGICDILEDAGWEVEAFDSCELFLDAYRERPGTCVVLDVHFPGMGGIELLSRIEAMGGPPVIVVSGSSEISEAVRSIQGGAVDFIEKPIVHDILIASVRNALNRSGHSNDASILRAAALAHIAGLTSRQRQIMALVLAGQPSKNIAADLGISQRTVENHRASIMQKMGADSLPALARLVVCSDCALVP